MPTLLFTAAKESLGCGKIDDDDLDESIIIYSSSLKHPEDAKSAHTHLLRVQKMRQQLARANAMYHVRSSAPPE